MATYPINSTRAQAIRCATEATWGTNPASGGLELNPQDYALPALEQATLPRNDGVRVGYMEPAPIAGVKGPGGPTLKFDLCSLLPSRASADTDAAPDLWARALLGAVVGEGAGVDTDGYTAGSGRVCGGSTIASVTSAGGNDQIDTITVQTGDGANFAQGDMIVMFSSAGVPYPVMVRSVSTDTLTIMGGPTAAEFGTVSGRTVLGTWSVVGAVGDSASAKDKSVTVEVIDSAAQPWQWTGCSGNAMVEVAAAGKAQMTFDFSSNAWATEAATLAGGTAWPAAARKRNVGVNGYVRVGTAGDDVDYPLTLLGTAEHFSSAKWDFGANRSVIEDASGPHGRAGNPINKFSPRLAISGYQAASYYALLGAVGAVQSPRSVCVVFGDATNGGFGVFLPQAILATQPTHADKSGLVGMDVEWQPQDHAGAFPQFIFFTF